LYLCCFFLPPVSTRAALPPSTHLVPFCTFRIFLSCGLERYGPAPYLGKVDFLVYLIIFSAARFSPHFPPCNQILLLSALYYPRSKDTATTPPEQSYSPDVCPLAALEYGFTLLGVLMFAPRPPVDDVLPPFPVYLVFRPISSDNRVLPSFCCRTFYPHAGVQIPFFRLTLVRFLPFMFSQKEREISTFPPGTPFFAPP